jgi:Cu-Zn family superoxide dismutase
MRTQIRHQWIGLVGLLATGACAGTEGDFSEREALGGVQEAQSKKKLSAQLIDTAGAPIGSVTVRAKQGVLEVSVEASGLTEGFHGMHVHANDNPTNGVGCVTPSFTAVDGHLNPAGNLHGEHAGDLPVLMAIGDGTASLSFVNDRVTLSEINGAAVIVHALPDNFHNIPVGTNPDQYTPNSAAATAATDATGNAGARVACGVLE